MIASSKHNIQYLLGGYRFFFFDAHDADGLEPLSAALRLFQGRAGALRLCRPRDGELGARQRHDPVPDDRSGEPQQRATRCAAPSPTSRARRKKLRIGVERAFLPADVGERAAREPARRGDRRRDPAARASARRKSKAELELLRKASDGVVDSMLAVIATHGPGTTKREIAEALRREEVQRGLNFEYCLIAAGAEPEPRALRPGVARGRRAVARFRRQLPAAISATSPAWPCSASPTRSSSTFSPRSMPIQQATRVPIAAGVMGSEVYKAAEAAIAKSPNCEARAFRRARHGADPARGAAAFDARRRSPTRPKAPASRSRPAW